MIFFNRLCVIIGDFDSFQMGDPVDFRLARSFVRSTSSSSASFAKEEAVF